MADDIVTQLEYFVTNEVRMPAGLVVSVINEIERLREQLQDARMHLEQDACEIDRLRAELAEHGEQPDGWYE